MLKETSALCVCVGFTALFLNGFESASLWWSKWTVWRQSVLSYFFYWPNKIWRQCIFHHINTHRCMKPGVGSRIIGILWITPPAGVLRKRRSHQCCRITTHLHKLNLMVRNKATHLYDLLMTTESRNSGRLEQSTNVLATKPVEFKNIHLSEPFDWTSSLTNATY